MTIMTKENIEGTILNTENTIEGGNKIVDGSMTVNSVTNKNQQPEEPRTETDESVTDPVEPTQGTSQTNEQMAAALYEQAAQLYDTANECMQTANALLSVTTNTQNLQGNEVEGVPVAKSAPMLLSAGNASATPAVQGIPLANVPTTDIVNNIIVNSGGIKQTTLANLASVVAGHNMVDLKTIKFTSGVIRWFSISINIVSGGATYMSVIENSGIINLFALSRWQSNYRVSKMSQESNSSHFYKDSNETIYIQKSKYGGIIYNTALITLTEVNAPDVSTLTLIV